MQLPFYKILNLKDVLLSQEFHRQSQLKLEVQLIHSALPIFEGKILEVSLAIHLLFTTLAKIVLVAIKLIIRVFIRPRLGYQGQAFINLEALRL